MAVLSVFNAAFATTLLLARFSGGQCAIISHESMLVSRRSQLIGTEKQLGHLSRRNITGIETAGKSASLLEMSKPIRIIRHGQAGAGGGDGPKHVTKKACGTTTKVNSESEKSEICPDDCPFYAQNRRDADFCTFTCVSEPECAQLHPETQIGDKSMGVCRSCIVEGCAHCDTSVMYDKCAKCQFLYYLGDDGLCYFRFYHDALLYIGYALAVVAVLVVLWIVDMAIRPVYNVDGLQAALDNRDACKLQTQESGKRELWSLFTNLLSKQVAGPGMMLHFNFQVALIIWGLFVAIVWMCFAQFIDPALWLLGTRSFGTPRNNCILVAWGYETQQRLMWTKVLFLVIVYCGSFGGAILYGILQRRKFEATDRAHKTMKDYVVMLTGIPHGITGKRPVENEIKEKLEGQISGTSVVGVSVAWEYADQEEQIQKYLQDELDEAEATEHVEVLKPDVNPIRKQLLALEEMIFLGEEEKAEEKTEEEKKPEPSMKEILENMHVSCRAFAVFTTEEERDEAIKAGSFKFGDSDVSIEEILNEPDTVIWHNFGRDSSQMQAIKLLAGFGFITLACAFWAVVFYGPYAYYVMTFNYENGRQPGFMVGFAFSMIVCVGNVIMYEVCAKISDWVGFRFRDQREACYMILYTVACMFNVALDFVTTYLTAEMVMEGLGFRTYFGVPLGDVPSFTEKFETYGMQRSLAENTYSYAFPSTFLIPFLIEPVPAVILPLLVGKWIVKSHVGLQGRSADGWLEMPPMDMGRYADLLLNAILGILIFYFPGGYTWMLFLGLACSHCYIYLFDHYKVLREIPACTYASFDIEFCAQAMFAPIIGIMVSCFVFKANCEPGFHCTRGAPLIALGTLGWFVHVVVHLLVLWFVVPLFSLEKGEDPEAGKQYQDVAKETPCSWFSTNKVHCLRYKVLFNEECSVHIVGKEKLMKANEGIGCFYEQKPEQKPEQK